jgi:hypothetical protein
MARPSISNRVLEGGRSVWAAADIVFPSLFGPLLGGSRMIDQLNTQALVNRSATQQFISLELVFDSVISSDSIRTPQ